MGKRRARWPRRLGLSVRIGDKHLTGDATAVFLRAIGAIGLECSAALAETWNGHRLVSRSAPQCLHSTSVGGWYVAIPHSSSEKHSVLLRLKEQLAFPMTITLTDPLKDGS